MKKTKLLRVLILLLWTGGLLHLCRLILLAMLPP